MPRNVNQPQVCPLVTISFNVASSKNRSNKFSRSLAFILRLTVGKNFFSFLGRDNKRVIEASLDAIVYLDVPIFKWRSDCLNLAFNTLFNWGQNNPAIRCAEVANHVLLLHEIARSEEHTSELQSRQYLVCRLLLEKKKTSILEPLTE